MTEHISWLVLRLVDWYIRLAPGSGVVSVPISVCPFYDVLSVLWGLNMPAELLKTCYAERNPSTLYIKGVQFVFTLNLEEEEVALMKLAADQRYERAVYTHAMTRKIFWDDDDEGYFARFPRESIIRIGKLV